MPQRCAALMSRNAARVVAPIFIEVRRPFRRRHFGHAAKQPFRRPCTHQQKTVGPMSNKGCTAPQRAFALGYSARKGFRIAACAGGAAFVPRAEDAGWFLRCADCSAEIHHRLREIAGAPLRSEFARQPAQFRFCVGQRRSDGEQPRNHPLNVAVDRARLCIERDRGDRGGRIGADAGKRSQRRLVLRKFAIVTLDDGAGAGVQVPGAGVVAESCPGLEHLLERCGCKRPHVAPAGKKAGVVWRNCLTVVCCSMISESQTRYGSARSPGGARHGNFRR